MKLYNVPVDMASICPSMIVLKYFGYRRGQPIRDGKTWVVLPRPLLKDFEKELSDQAREELHVPFVDNNHVAYLVNFNGENYGVRIDDAYIIICDDIVEGTE
jgi:hypothetical protein